MLLYCDAHDALHRLAVDGAGNDALTLAEFRRYLYVFVSTTGIVGRRQLKLLRQLIRFGASVPLTFVQPTDEMLYERPLYTFFVGKKLQADCRTLFGNLPLAGALALLDCVMVPGEKWGYHKLVRCRKSLGKLTRAELDAIIGASTSANWAACASVVPLQEDICVLAEVA